MTNLEITKLCAEAMDLDVVVHHADGYEDAIVTRSSAVYAFRSDTDEYDPLHDDAQAMALVKRFYLMVTPIFHRGLGREWVVTFQGRRDDGSSFDASAQDPTFNRAIVECVAAMQKRAKPSPMDSTGAKK